MPFIDNDAFYNAIAKANETLYATGQYQLYYNKIVELLNIQLNDSFGYIDPLKLQKLTLSEIIENETTLIPFLYMFASKLSYMPELDESCYIEPNDTCDFSKLYSYYLSIPDTTDKLSKICYLSLKVNDYEEKIDKDYLEYEQEQKQYKKRIEEEDDRSSRMYYWCMADKYDR